MKLSNIVALIALPAVATVLVFLDQDVIAGALMAIDTLLGILLLVGSKGQQQLDFDGFVTSDGVDELSGHPDLRFVITKDPMELLDQGHMNFRVGRPPEQPV